MNRAEIIAQQKALREMTPEERNAPVMAEPTGVPETDVSFTEAERRLLEQVEATIIQMKNHLLAMHDEFTPSFTEINKALLGHEHFLIELTKIYNRVKFNLDRAKNAFATWQAEEYMRIREEVNRRDNHSTWYSAKELDNMVISRNKEKYNQLQAAITRAECERSFVQRMIDSWDGYKFILNQVSRNSIAEFGDGPTSSNAAKYDPQLGA